MMEPEGPLPTSVYWRRRVAAAVGAALAMVATIWALGSLIGSEEPAPGTPRAASNEEAFSADALADSSVPQAPISSAASEQASSLLPPPPFESGASDASSLPLLPEESAGLSASLAPSAMQQRRQDHGKPLQRCQDRMLHVDARIAKQTFQVGERPHMQLSVTNDGRLDCYADLSRDDRRLTVFTKDGKRVWSSSDCYFGKQGREIHRLRSGQVAAFDLDWAGRTSAPGCPVQRDTVGPGRYTVIAKAGELTSKPTPFAIRR